VKKISPAAHLTPAALRPAGTAAWVAFVFLLALFTYWPSLHGEFLWDDAAHVTRAALRSWSGLWQIWFEPGSTQQYYPVLHTAFWIEHRLWGDATWPYHLTNIFLHAANGCLLAVLLRRLWSRSIATDWSAVEVRFSAPRWAEWLAACLFVVHPVGVESVAWITEQKNTLSAAFYLLAALVYLRFVDGRKLWLYAVALGLYLLALGTKTTTATLPAALLIVLWWKQGRLAWRRDVLPLLPWFACAVPAGLVTAWVERTMIGAELVVPDATLVERTFLASRVLCFYIGKFLWPADLTFFYPLWNVAAQSRTWLPYLVAALAVTTALWLYRKRGRAPLAVWLLFGGTLFPALGFFKVFPFAFSYVADHFQYLAMPTGVGAAVAGLSVTIARLPLAWRRAGPFLGGALVLILALLSRGHSRLYLNDESLFQANIAANPTSWMGHHILAQRIGKTRHRRAEAIALFHRAIALNPSSAESHAALAGLLVKEPGHGEEAIALFREAIRLRPTYAEAHNGLANELLALPGHLPEAIAHYETALRLRPDFALAQANLASALAQDPARRNEALSHFERALKIVPDYAPAHYYLANLLATIPERRSEAVFHYEQTMRLRPNATEVLLALGNVLVELGRVPEALTRFEAALRIDPQLVDAHYALAVNLLGARDRTADVARHLDETLRLSPNYVEAHNLRGAFFAQQGRMDEARKAWIRALEIAPDFEPARRNLWLLDKSTAR
jgi:tetratricopeptide (TPR) repeat protein